MLFPRIFSHKTRSSSSSISKRRRLRGWKRGGLTLALYAICIGSSLGAPPNPSPKPLAQVALQERVEAAAQKAITAMLEFQGEGGWFSDFKDRNRLVKAVGHKAPPPSYSIPMTALAIMSMASVGHQASDPTPQGKAMDQALEFILRDDLAERDGYMGRNDNSRMYGHGIVTLMMGELIGMTRTAEQDRRLRTRLQSAVDLILRSQQVRKSPSEQGGWRYEPESRESDMSVTVWQLMSLRAAQNAGLKVPKEAINDAVGYLRRCYSAEDDLPGRGGRKKAGTFAYMTNKGERRLSTTAAGLLSLQVCGEYNAPEVSSASDFLLAHPPTKDDRWFFYGIYYYAQGMYQRGGEHADTSHQIVADILLEKQQEDGLWMPNGEERRAGPVYATAMAILSLSVEHHFLPIYQR